MEQREIPYYYSKPKWQMKDCTTGMWVYDSTAKLCFVEITEDENGKHYRLHSNGIETTCFADTVVYPLTFTTQRIAETVRNYYDHYFYANIMNADFRRELEDDFHELMHIDLNSDDYEDQYHKIIECMEDHLQEMLRHAEALHIRPRRK